MGQYLLWAFAAYILYNFIFRFVIPLVRVTRQVKKQVREFQEQANTQPDASQYAGSRPNGPGTAGPQYGAYQHQPFEQTTTQTTPGKAEPKPRKDDYIDFEEVK